ncbi:hypothetical protein RI129_005296 [Pyrocoelia pectoralis]|uniref:C2H2-type domain-containing protein n=1 Tax=Pyrocoelia pectoralis TaxID=417401 RepID=A0AAN7ZK83_9COLE
MNVLKNIDLHCGICGESHHYSECKCVPLKKQIPDKVFLSKARASLPEIVTIQIMADGTLAIAANTFIEKGTQFGPLQAQKLITLDPTITFPLKIFNNNEDDFSEYYLNTADEHNCNWIMFITPAQYLEEQNLICFQHKSDIVYMCVKDINEGTLLKVWYSDYYAKLLKKEPLTPQIVANNNTVAETVTLETIDMNKLLKKQQKLVDRENWTCKFCGKLENNIAQFSNHIIDHYNEKRKINCDECNQTFTTKKRLRRHMKEVHNETTAIKVRKNTEADATKPKELIVGGPLLNDLLTDSLDNTNLILPNIELNLNVLENDALNLSVDNLLNDNVKELDHFNFDITESQEQFVCDVCLKVFAKLKYLIQHLKKHTGRFTCGHCLKIFCRKENLDVHKCPKNNQQESTHECTICSKSFALKRYLRRHTDIVHNRLYACEKCNKINNSIKDYNQHNCSALSGNAKQVFPCTTCGKNFSHIRYLKKHMATHKGKQRIPVSQNFICEICGINHKTRSGLFLHMKAHNEPSVECPVCKKRFHRFEAFRQHSLSHVDSKVTCNICNKELKNERVLKSHMRQHTGLKQYKCDKCPRRYAQAANLNKHNLQEHLNRCKVCNEEFKTAELLAMHRRVHSLKNLYICPICHKSIKLKYSLVRHVKKIHPDHDHVALLSNIQPSVATLEEQSDKENEKNTSTTSLEELGNDCGLSHITVVQESDNDSNFDSIVDNFENIINSYNVNSNDNLSLTAYSDPKPIENERRILDFTDLQMDIDSNFDVNAIGINNQDICLSMPDLTESDQEIMLGDSAFILDNGTIVEPKDQGNVLVYVLDKSF